MPSPEPLLELSGVSKVYPMGEVHVAALHGVDLKIAPGEFIVILGPSGSGKSTLLNIMGGMDRPTAGTVVFRGKELGPMPEAELTRYRRHQVGFIFQFFSLISSLTARENVELAGEVAGIRVDGRGLLARVGLGGREDRFPAQLSGGEQQRVAIARALAKNPAVLLCDEPTGALDLETGRLVLALLDEVNRRDGKTVIVITHNAAIAHLADRVVCLRSGTIAGVTTNPRRASPEEIRW